VGAPARSFLVAFGLLASAPGLARAQDQGEPGGAATGAPNRPPSSPAVAPSSQPLSSVLEVEPGATCLAEQPLEAEVQTWLRRDRLGPELRVRVIGDAHDPRSVFFRIERGKVKRERRFANLPPGCDEATAVVALAIALAIDADAVPGLITPGDGDDEAARPIRVAAAQLAAGYQVLSAGSVGLTLGAEVGLTGWFSLRADVLGQGAWSNSIDGVPGVFDTVVAAAVPQVCAGGSVAPRVHLDLCSGAGFGMIHVQGRGYAVSHGSTGSWVVATGGVRLLLEAGLRWAVDVDGVFPLHTPAILAEDTQGSGRLRQPNPAGALLSVGPAFTF
jgi:hypothetical protein